MIEEKTEEQIRKEVTKLVRKRACVPHHIKAMLDMMGIPVSKRSSKNEQRLIDALVEERIKVQAQLLEYEIKEGDIHAALGIHR